MKVIAKIIRIIISPLVFVLGIGVSFFILALGGFLSPLIAIGCWFRPVSDSYPQWEKNMDISDALTVFATIFLAPFALWWSWIQDGVITD